MASSHQLHSWYMCQTKFLNQRMRGRGRWHPERLILIVKAAGNPRKLNSCSPLEPYTPRQFFAARAEAAAMTKSRGFWETGFYYNPNPCDPDVPRDPNDQNETICLRPQDNLSSEVHKPNKRQQTCRPKAMKTFLMGPTLQVTFENEERHVPGSLVLWTIRA